MQCVWQWNICHYIFDTFFIKAALNIYPAPVFLLTPKTVRELWTFIGIEKETLAISVCGKENSVTIFLNMHDCLLLIGHSNMIQNMAFSHTPTMSFPHWDSRSLPALYHTCDNVNFVTIFLNMHYCLLLIRRYKYTIGVCLSYRK